MWKYKAMPCLSLQQLLFDSVNDNINHDDITCTDILNTLQADHISCHCYSWEINNTFGFSFWRCKENLYMYFKAMPFWFIFKLNYFSHDS